MLLFYSYIVNLGNDLKILIKFYISYYKMLGVNKNLIKVFIWYGMSV